METKKKWFEGTQSINCQIEILKSSVENHGHFFAGVVNNMPGILNTDILEQGKEHVIIKTNEGIMKRTHISKQIGSDSITVEFKEEYQAGKRLTVYSHYLEEFKGNAKGLTHRLVISDVAAAGLIGFFYRIFASANIGRAVLRSYKTYLEKM